MATEAPRNSGEKNIGRKTKSMRKFRAVDLFCGCGGLSLGLKQAGFDVIGAVDIDSLATETYKANHRGVKIWQKDITKISVQHLMRRLNLCKGELDLLAGCPPCQGYSSLRTLNGKNKVNDPRNDLVFCFLEFVLELRPKAVMMENVPGLADDERMIKIKRELRRAGYQCEVRVVDAADYGVPQRRRRMILLAGLMGSVEFAKPDSCRRTVRDALTNMPEPGQSGDALHDFPEERTPAVMERIRKIPFDGGSRSALSPDDQLECHKRLQGGFRDIYGRMKWDAVAPTITSGCTNPSKGRFLHPEQHRAITLREAAILQTFPNNYYFALRRGKGAASTMIGNALPPEFIKRHAQLLSAHLKQRTRR